MKKILCAVLTFIAGAVSATVALLLLAQRLLGEQFGRLVAEALRRR